MEAPKIDIVNAILRLYDRIYDELYEREYRPMSNNSLGVKPEAEASQIEWLGVAYYDGKLRHNAEMMSLVGECVKRRQDFFSSDREVSALVWTLDELGLLK